MIARGLFCALDGDCGRSVQPVTKLLKTNAPLFASNSLTAPAKTCAAKRVLPLTVKATPEGPFSPVINFALIAAPVVALYSPTVPLPSFTTKRVLPVTPSPVGAFNPVMKLALIAAPLAALLGDRLLHQKPPLSGEIPASSSRLNCSLPRVRREELTR